MLFRVYDLTRARDRLSSAKLRARKLVSAGRSAKSVPLVAGEGPASCSIATTLGKNESCKIQFQHRHPLHPIC